MLVKNSQSLLIKTCKVLKGTRRRLMLLLICLFFIFYSKAQVYNNVVSYSVSSVTTGIKIITNIPFTSATLMPTIHIYGYNYGAQVPIDLTIVYYMYNNNFIHTGVSSAGGYTPPISLANENSKVVIYIDDQPSNPRFTIDVFSKGRPGDSDPTIFQGWTVSDEALTGTNTILLPYINRFSGNVYLSNGIWKSDGSVGIGTTTPSSKLEVAGKIISSTDGTASGSYQAENSQNGNVYFKTNTNSGNGYVNVNALDGTTAVYLNSSGKSYFNGGNVLIGKTSQTNSGYKLDVAGNIRADKLVVNTTGADYVFDSSYNLMSLDSVEQFIRQNHHLPQIASADSMQNNGLDVGENQTKLLQKTEELTLYIIQQNQTINQQKAQIDSLEASLNKLEQRLQALETKLTDK